MTPEQLRAYHQQRQQMAARQAQLQQQQAARGQVPAPRPMTPLPKTGPVHNVKPHVQSKTTGGCCGRRWQA
ncbi:hypothetical protein [Brevibacillus nitrificans]|uniref:Uncharacterized protein n=1 Tax=Brevibacillus nitrificans TaxID=651560 RepID=A0A3M8D8G1_9BACL|nr:hypothetical protein [Brevibacillus nitrificans]MDR7314939.1 hypothetical protein [Brevibacillus nitrificans]MED1796234.1 hypothetical protein [Brevibacillus nitrificans]RNB84248.1 hypothetical protein EDM59_17265 [Brevibacillus nitrificans]